MIQNTTERVTKPREHGAILMYSRRVSLKFSLTLKRRVGFTAYLVMMPCAFLSLMTTVIFCLPTERPDRHMLGEVLFSALSLITFTPTIVIFYLSSLSQGGQVLSEDRD